MKHLKLYEEFEEFKKPSLMQRAIKGTKRFFGVEKKEDRKELEKIHRFIDHRSGEFNVDLIKDVNEIKPGVIVANLIIGNVVVDCNDLTIMWKGKELELNDIEYEVESLYDRLKSLITDNGVIESWSSWFSPKPLGDVELAKKDSIKSIREFLRRYSGVVDVDGLSDQQLLDLIKGFARHSKYSKENALAAELWRIAKPLFR